MTATNPQSPASPLPEASEPVAFQYWTVGEFWKETSKLGYEARRDAGEKVRALYEHAAPSPVAQAPAQAGEVVEAIRVLWEEIGTYSVQCTKTGELAPCRSLVDAVDALAALATQPLAAPVQQEAEAGEVAAKDGFYVLPFEAAPDYRLHLQIRGAIWRYVIEDATPPAQPVLAPVVREPLTYRQVQKFYAMLPDGQSAYANFVQGFRSAERAHGIQATTGEQSHG